MPTLMFGDITTFASFVWFISARVSSLRPVVPMTCAFPRFLVILKCSIDAFASVKSMTTSHFSITFSRSFSMNSGLSVVPAIIPLGFPTSGCDFVSTRPTISKYLSSSAHFMIAAPIFPRAPVMINFIMIYPCPPGTTSSSEAHTRPAGP